MKRTTNRVSGHLISVYLMAIIYCSSEADNSYLFPLNIFPSSKKKLRSFCRSSASMYHEASSQIFDPVPFGN